MKTANITDFLTQAQIEQAHACFSAAEIRELVIEPNIAQINQKLGQENDPMYLALACEYVFRKSGAWEIKEL